MGLLLALAPPGHAQAAPPPVVRIIGTVTGQDGDPLGGATVTASALNLNASVLPDGHFALPIPANRVTAGQSLVLTARFIGYKVDTKTVVLTGSEITVAFALKRNPLLLGEIVVTGEGTTSSVEKLGNVHTTVDTTLLQHSGELNIVSALSAKAPNVEVRSAAGDPGASSSIHIRGINTLGGTGQPLFVIDGTPVDNTTIATETVDRSGYYAGSTGGTYAPNRASDIDPNDIESIEILKGAAAGSIYGARAGQGVILITTKHGKPGKSQYSLQSTYSSDHVTNTPKLQQEFGQGNNGIADACAASTGPADCYGGTGAWGARLAPGTPVYNNATDILTDGYTTDNQLTISGGGERTQFFLSTGYSYQTGIWKGPDDSYKKIPIRFKGSQQLFDNLTVGANIAYTYTDGRFEQKGSNYGGMYTTSLRTPPDFNNAMYLDPLSGLHRSYQFPHPSTGSTAMTRGLDNPFFDAYQALNSATNNRTFGNVTVDYQPLSWLKINETLGEDQYTDNRLEGIPQTSSDPPSPLGQVIASTFSYRQIDHNLTATASYTINPKWSGAVTVGQNLNSREFHTMGQIGDELIAPLPFNLENTQSQEQPSDHKQSIHDEGYFAQATADLVDQLYLKAGVRYDGSSTFGTANRNWFPSVSGAWEFTKLEAAHHALGFLTYGKIRAAYGEVGTEPPPYVTNTVFVNGSFSDDLTSLSATQHGMGGLFTGTIRPSAGLLPERTKELEAGIDIGFLNDRADASFTWYKRRSSDVILNIPVTPATGFTRQTANGAELQNIGEEATVNFRPISHKNISWDAGVTFGINRNKVLSLRGADFVAYTGTINGFTASGGAMGGQVAKVGYALGVFQGTDFVRCGRGVMLTDGTNIDDECGAQGVKDKALYISPSGFPIVDQTDRIVGDPNPKWTAGVHTSFRYKQLTIGGLLDIRHGGTVYNATRGVLNSYGQSIETLRRGDTVTFGSDYFAGKVAGPGSGNVVVLGQSWFKGPNQYFQVSAPFMEDGGFVKLREISLGYTMTKGAIVRSLGLSSLQMRVAGRNLFTWTKYTGADPETSLSGGDTGVQGVDYFNNPQTRSMLVSLVLNR